jgi:uncharacterized protein (DUF1501 family)
MLHRRDFLTRSLQASSLLAVGSVVPEFLASTAHAVAPGDVRRSRDTVLVVIEMSGGNDGLNTVIPFGDDLYHKSRPTLRFTKDQVIKLDDHVGLHPGMRPLEKMFKDGQLAVVQGVGYPNPDRSHFESMDIWQSADIKRKTPTGWLGRSAGNLVPSRGGVPLLHIGGGRRLPVALRGAAGGAISIENPQAFRLDFGGGDRHVARRQLMEDLAAPGEDENLLSFVHRRQVQTLTSIDRLHEALRTSRNNGGYYSQISRRFYQGNALPPKMQLISQLIQRRLGTRVFYVSIDGFDTHSSQATMHQNLLAEVADGIHVLFEDLKRTRDEQRVRVLTFSEFGRRVRENGSKGTDHGAASCLFVAGPSVKGGVIGKHPSLSDLGDGDLKHHTDFRAVYATLLDHWLGCDSKTVLGAPFPAIDGLRPRA